MSVIHDDTAYFRIFKSCGDNSPETGMAYEIGPRGSGVYEDEDAHLGADAGVHHFLVEPHRFYTTRKAAEKRAEELARETPGNRYYVMESVSCFMASEPKVERKSYR